MHFAFYFPASLGWVIFTDKISHGFPMGNLNPMGFQNFPWDFWISHGKYFFPEISHGISKFPMGNLGQTHGKPMGNLWVILNRKFPMGNISQRFWDRPLAFRYANYLTLKMIWRNFFIKNSSTGGGRPVRPPLYTALPLSLIARFKLNLIKNNFDVPKS